MDAEVVIYCGEDNNLDYDVELEEGEVLEEVRFERYRGYQRYSEQKMPLG